MEKEERCNRASELVLTAEGTPYHTHLNGENMADNILLVGDPGRVELFKRLFDHIDYESINREIHILSGTYRGTTLSVVSTGMGCDNIDIVLTELDAAANIDLTTGRPHCTHRKLRIVRIGTCGSLQADLPCGSHVASSYAVGLDGLLNYYQHSSDGFVPELEKAFCEHVTIGDRMAYPYAAACSNSLLQQIASNMPKGITVTAPGFYAPQGRYIRIAPTLSDINEQLATFEWNGLHINNFEMETSAIYGMCQMFGHEALTVCLVIANRVSGKFINNYEPQMLQLIKTVIDSLCN